MLSCVMIQANGCIPVKSSLCYLCEVEVIPPNVEYDEGVCDIEDEGEEVVSTTTAMGIHTTKTKSIVLLLLICLQLILSQF